MVIAAYKPKPGRAAALLALTVKHVPYLRALGSVTDRPHLTMRAKDAAMIEVFAWRDGDTTRAHEMPEMHALWARFAALCEYVPLRRLAEAEDLFAMFEPVDF